MRGPARAVEQTRKAGALTIARLLPTPPPAVRRRRRDIEARRRLPNRTPIRDSEHELVPPSKSELRVTVKLHLALL